MGIGGVTITFDVFAKTGFRHICKDKQNEALNIC